MNTSIQNKSTAALRATGETTPVTVLPKMRHVRSHSDCTGLGFGMGSGTSAAARSCPRYVDDSLEQRVRDSASTWCFSFILADD